MLLVILKKEYGMEKYGLTYDFVVYWKRKLFAEKLLFNKYLICVLSYKKKEFFSTSICAFGSGIMSFHKDLGFKTQKMLCLCGIGNM